LLPESQVGPTDANKDCIMKTYDLDTHIPCFIGEFLDRQKKGLDNTWILKPANLARSMDTWVTNNVE